MHVPLIHTLSEHSKWVVQATDDHDEKDAKERALDPSPEISPPSSPVMSPAEFLELPELSPVSPLRVLDDRPVTQRIHGNVDVVSQDLLLRAQ